jgi:hypothetical protein
MVPDVPRERLHHREPKDEWMGSTCCDDRPAQPLAAFMAIAAVHVFGNVLYWAQGRLQVAEITRDAAAAALVAANVVTFVWATARLAISGGRGGAVVATITAVGAFYVSDLVLLALGVLWLPGMYQIDFPVEEFIPEMVLETTLFAGGLTGVAWGIACAAIAVSRWMRSRGAHPDPGHHRSRW